MISVVVVREGVMPDGGFEAIAEAGGAALVVEWAPVAAQAEALRSHVASHDAVVLPASPDGRDLAPHLAAALQRPLFAGATAVVDDRVTLARHGGRVLDELVVHGPFVATLEPGSRSANVVAFNVVDIGATDGGSGVQSVEVFPPDPATVDLVEAPRIVGGGAGLDSAERLTALGEVAVALGASLGATRVVTDRGWVEHERQIGTTGVLVDPDLYLAFGVSGAVQHTGGLGNPDHIVAVNLDPHCPMMQLADLAIVADANEVVAELLARLKGGAHG
jgi:electron transfer flavoprotein alpha subunit